MSEHITGVPGIVDYAQFVTETQINSSVANFSLLVNYRLLAMFWDIKKSNPPNLFLWYFLSILRTNFLFNWTFITLM